jgi:small subunit ribosomal protein S7e
LLDLEANTDLKAQLRELHITGAREVDVHGGKKSIIVYVPVPQLKSFQKIHNRLVRELEKKFNGKHFVVVANVCVMNYYNNEMKSIIIYISREEY